MNETHCIHTLRSVMYYLSLVVVLYSLHQPQVTMLPQRSILKLVVRCRNKVMIPQVQTPICKLSVYLKQSHNNQLMHMITYPYNLIL